jgi:hypothetical protein
MQFQADRVIVFDDPIASFVAQFSSSSSELDSELVTRKKP